MKRKMVVFLIIVGMALSMVPTTAARQEVTLTYAIWDNNQLPAHEQIMDAFMAENPGIKVDIQVVPWGNYWEKLQTAVAGGEAYDVFWMNGPNFPVYASREVLMNIQGLVDSGDIDLGVYPESLVNLYSYQGELYGVPKDFDTIGLYYNVDMFDAAGLDYPNAEWTWDDLKAAAETLTRDGNWGFAATTEDQSGYWNFIYQNGGEVIAEDGSHVLIDEPASCEAIQFLYDFVAQGYSPDGATQATLSPAVQLFPGGKVAMITAGSWMARTYLDAEPNINVAPLPMGSAGRATIIHGLANVAWSKTAHPKEAQLLLEFLGSERAALILAQSGTVIPAYEGMQQAWVDSMPEMNLQEAFIDALAYAVPYPTAAQGMEWNTKIAELLGEVWSGNLDAANVCAMAAEAANDVLQAE